MPHLIQPSAEASVELCDAGPRGAAARLQPAASLTVLAAAPGLWDLQQPASWPRVPGGVFLARAEQDGGLHLGTGFLPCARCPSCAAGLHLACSDPVRPGWNAPGALASELWLPAERLWPLPNEALDLATLRPRVAPLLALMGAAGPLYQAVALAGMAPGDTALVLGPAGPGAFPLRLLLALGLRPIWIAPEQRRIELEGVVHSDTVPQPADWPTPRAHILDLAASAQSLALWAPVARHCVSCSFVGPQPPPGMEPAAVLGGQGQLRWVKDLHPHLALDLLGLVAGQRVGGEGALELEKLDRVAIHLEAMEQAHASHSERGWPVFVPSNAWR